MKISLDEYDKVRAIVPGLFQFNENEMFSQAALAVTDDCLYFYDDNAPTQIMGEVYHYIIKKRVSLDDIVMVLNEKITNNRQLKNMARLNFVMEDEEDELIFYYYLSDKGDADRFIKELAGCGIKTKKRSVDLSADKL
ncbi:MAG: hypothetical protein IK028_04945 [Bacilli bacterium]|nr:hypothetical protein [Bacilli bacterium]